MNMQDDFTPLITKLKAPAPITWVFIGDSITHGALHTYGYRSFPEIFNEHIRCELNRRMDIVINSGISGNKASDIVESLDWRVLRFRPDVVFIMVGTNDCTLGSAGLQKFESDLTTMVRRIRSAGSLCIINTPNAICVEIANSRSSLPDYVKVMHKVAQDQATMLIDHFAHWSSIKPTRDELMPWLNDSIHPNYFGHIAIAYKIFDCLDIHDDSPTCHFWLP